MRVDWSNLSNLPTGKFQCGYCGEKIASNVGFSCKVPENPHYVGHIYICHNCTNPTYIDTMGNQYPGEPFGKDVKHIKPKEVTDLYKESRECMKVHAYTASVMCSRKILMNIAVDKSAKEGLRYEQYVDYLAEKGYVPPNSKEWVDTIRKKGNEANHEIKTMTRKDAEQLINFVEMILRFIYEFPASFKKDDEIKQESKSNK